jgi:hypothetical protein
MERLGVANGKLAPIRHRAEVAVLRRDASAIGAARRGQTASKT